MCTSSIATILLPCGIRRNLSILKQANIIFCSDKTITTFFVGILVFLLVVINFECMAFFE